MLTIGLSFMAIATYTYFYGPLTKAIRIPAYLLGEVRVGFRSFPTYRVFLIVVGVALIAALWYGFDRTSLGAKIRAAVDNRRMAQSVGIDVDRLFILTFAIGSGLAALGGGLAIQLLGLTPNFAVIYLVFFLLVVAVGGSGSLWGTLVGALVLGISDTAGKYLFADAGSFVIYAVAVLILLSSRRALWTRVNRPSSRPPARSPSPARAPPPCWSRRDRLRAAEVLPWLAAVVAFFIFPSQMVLGGQTLIMILFALSLDLIFGYAGIVTLGHAAYFGIGGYTAALMITDLGWNEPISGIFFARPRRGDRAGCYQAGYCCVIAAGAVWCLRYLQRIMLQQLGNVFRDFTGGYDGVPGVTVAPLFGRFDYDLYGHTYYLYCLVVLLVCFYASAASCTAPFGRALIGIRENVGRMHAVGSPVHRRLVAAYTISAGLAGIAGAFSRRPTR